MRDDHLRYLERWGLIRGGPSDEGELAYDFAELSIIKQAAAELTRGTPFRAVLRALVAEHQGQLALDFRPLKTETSHAKVVALPVRAGTPPEVSSQADEERRMAAVRHFLDGAALDLSGPAHHDAAMSEYRCALTLDPSLVPALINLANIHYARDALVEAQALYEQASRLDEASVEAWYNLGHVHHDLGRYETAAGCYRAALDRSPEYAEAHVYLAVTLEKLGRSQDARPHWRAYQTLAPDGEWIELAREFGE